MTALLAGASWIVLGACRAGLGDYAAGAALVLGGLVLTRCGYNAAMTALRPRLGIGPNPGES